MPVRSQAHAAAIRKGRPCRIENRLELRQIRIVFFTGSGAATTGGAAGTNVEMIRFSLGYDLSTQKPTAIATFICIAKAEAGQFTIPSWVLLALPPSFSLLGVSFGGYLTVSNSAVPVSFTTAAPAIDFGLLTFGTSSTKSVTYQ